MTISILNVLNMLTKNILFIIRIGLGLYFFFIMGSCQNSTNENSNWTFYRGTNLNGVSLNKDLPLTWNENENIVWKTTIHGKGGSSPVIFADQIWLTTADSAGKQLYAVCTSFKTGEIIHNVKVFVPDSIIRIHALNTHATPTPAIEEGYVYVHYGSMGTACLETRTGKIIWKREDLKCNHVQGAASSPIIYKDLLILHYEGVDIQYIVALNKKTGKTIWKAIRPQEFYVNQPEIARKAYITPIVINVNGNDMLVSNGSEICIAYDPLTGEEIWRILYISDSTISMPMFSNGLVIFTTGLLDPIRLMAYRPEGKGDITNTNIVWQFDKNVPAINSPFVNNGLLYMIHEKGTITCLETASGKLVYTNKLKGDFYSSPICADNKIYILSKKGLIYVIREGREFKMLAENQIDGELMASIAISGRSLLLRSNIALYRIENLK
jgi:outer membrane protein assembly factor BamB